MHQQAILIILLIISFRSYAQIQSLHGIIPQPVSVLISEGRFQLTNETAVKWNNPADSATGNMLNERLLKKLRNSNVFATAPYKTLQAINLVRSSSADIPEEGYKLIVNENEVTIKSADGAGIFYGMQTLLQLIVEDTATARYTIPVATISDYPRYKWRGMHLDVARHFFSKEEVKQYIDYLAAYKFNTFHWHLTDDQGWRIEIKKYPLLTSTGAWRNGTLIGHYSNEPTFDTVRYGGFYTQEDVREIVAYAEKRAITIVPEIEMPGHVQALLAAYPQLACGGTTFEVGKTWGVYNNVLCPTGESIEFMKNVLLEVMDLFPSHYIHIGGDECPKEQWEKSEYCQNLMVQLGLKDETALQSYFTGQIDDFVNQHGRSIIGWDEILEGGLSPNAAVMSWRGMEGGIAAASAGHEVVMSPTEFCYFDYYQSANGTEPLAIGGFIPLDKVYAFEPTPDALPKEKQLLILGGQANVWTEYIPTFSKLQYMIFPRMCAMSEVLWTKKENRNFKDFTKRLTSYHFPEFNRNGIYYSKALYEVKMEIRRNNHKNGLIVRLTSGDPAALINYNLSSYENEILQATNNTQFEAGPIDVAISKSVIMNAIARDASGIKSAEVVKSFNMNLATGRTITLGNEPDQRYNNGGSFTLVNGISGRLPWNGSEWLGFSGTNLEAVIDLGQPENVSKITLGLLHAEGSWIYLPKEVTIALSLDGNNFRVAGKKTTEAIEKSGGRSAAFLFEKTQARYIKITAVNYGIIPSGKSGAGHPAWLFADEISVQ